MLYDLHNVMIYTDGDRMGDPSRKVSITVEIGLLGTERVFRTLMKDGLVPTETSEAAFAGRGKPESSPPLSSPAWYRAGIHAITTSIAPSFERPGMYCKHISAATSFGVTTAHQAVCALVLHCQAPDGERPDRLFRWASYPTGEMCHPSWGRMPLMAPMMLRWFLNGTAEGEFFYALPSLPPNEPNKNNMWRNKWRRIRMSAIRKNEKMRSPKPAPRVSPRLEAGRAAVITDSAKRRRQAAVNVGAGSSTDRPGAAALAALGAEADAAVAEDVLEGVPADMVVDGAPVEDGEIEKL